MSNRMAGTKGFYHEPALELSFNNFVASLLAKAIAHVKSREL
jgi:hypothetical protein